MMDRKKLLLLYNPSAGRAQTSRNLDMLLQKFCTGGCETTVYPILDGLNAEDILAGAESAGYDIVVCCGGDGTLHHTVNGLLRLEQPPLLGYIPSGSTNDFAASLGLPKTPEDAADAVVTGRMPSTQGISAVSCSAMWPPSAPFPLFPTKRPRT